MTVEFLDISSAPKDVEILVGKWYEDTSDGYFGESRWLWITQGIIDSEGNFFEAFNDTEVCAEHMTLAREPTHWATLPSPPAPSDSQHSLNTGLIHTVAKQLINMGGNMLKRLRDMADAIIDRELVFCPNCGYYCTCGNKDIFIKTR